MTLWLLELLARLFHATAAWAARPARWAGAAWARRYVETREYRDVYYRYLATGELDDHGRSVLNKASEYGGAPKHAQVARLRQIVEEAEKA